VNEKPTYLTLGEWILPYGKQKFTVAISPDSLLLKCCSEFSCFWLDIILANVLLVFHSIFKKLTKIFQIEDLMLSHVKVMLDEKLKDTVGPVEK
jgi:hypothetical protein